MSQNEVGAEKMVSGKDGTVTRTQMQYGNNNGVSNNLASTKYVDDMSSGLKSETDQLPQGVKSASIVPSGETGENKRETNQSQNTVMGGDQPATIASGDQGNNQ